MNSRATIAVLAVLLALGGSLFAAQRRVGMRHSEQYEREMQDPIYEDPPDAEEKTEWAFARLRYRGPGQSIRSRWGTDSNKAERIFMQGVRRLTRVHTRSVEEIIDVDSDEIFNWPWIYAVEVGGWDLSEAQARRLREYLDRGGFLMVDDFHGSYEWAAFMASLKRIFPDRQVVDLEDANPILHMLYDLDDRFQVPGLQFVRSGRTYEQDGVNAEWRAVEDDQGRIQVAICHNMDLGDAWEWADLPQYPEKFTSEAYRIGMNYLVYAFTH
jgi:Domain of unknown function (DUF4159)